MMIQTRMIAFLKRESWDRCKKCTQYFSWEIWWRELTQTNLSLIGI